MAMDSETTKVALDLLRAIRTDMDAVREDMREIKRCLTSLERHVADLELVLQAFRAE